MRIFRPLWFAIAALLVSACGGDRFGTAPDDAGAGVDGPILLVVDDAGDADLGSGDLDSSSGGEGAVLEHDAQASEDSPLPGPDAGDAAGTPPPDAEPPPAVCCYWPPPDAGTAQSPSVSRGPCQRVVISSSDTSECMIGVPCVWVDPHGAGNFGLALACP